MPIIALARRLPPAVHDQIATLGTVRQPAGPAVSGPDELRHLVTNADALLVSGLDRVDADTIAAASRLRLICNIAVGVDNIDLTAARARGITVTNTPGAMNDAVADLVFALLLGVARRTGAADAFVREGRWTPDNLTGFGMGLDVARKTLGIIGLGRIGCAVARRASGFDMDVRYCGPRADPAIEAQCRARHVTQDTLLAEADFVVVQVPYTADTHHLIGAAELARMKPSAVLIHAGRGGVVDDVALAEALRSGRIAGAGIDCFEGEPGVHPDLLAAPNVLLTPHIGSATPATRQTMVMMAVHNLAVGLAGGTPPNIV